MYPAGLPVHLSRPSATLQVLAGSAPSWSSTGVQPERSLPLKSWIGCSCAGARNASTANTAAHVKACLMVVSSKMSGRRTNDPYTSPGWLDRRLRGVDAELYPPGLPPALST